MLESALGAAEQYWFYTEAIYQTAAVMLTFLKRNSIIPTMTSDQLYSWIINIATSQLEKEYLARKIAENIQHTKTK